MSCPHCLHSTKGHVKGLWLVDHQGTYMPADVFRACTSVSRAMYTDCYWRGYIDLQFFSCAVIMVGELGVGGVSQLKIQTHNPICHLHHLVVTPFTCFCVSIISNVCEQVAHLSPHVNFMTFCIWSTPVFLYYARDSITSCSIALKNVFHPQLYNTGVGTICSSCSDLLT